MKKAISLLLALLQALSLAACGGPAPARVPGIFSAAYPLCVDEQDAERDVTLFFEEGAEDLPYIEARDLAGLLEWLAREYLCEPDYALTLEMQGSRAVFTRENESAMVIDFAAGTLEFPDHNAFIQDAETDDLIPILWMDGEVDRAGEPCLLRKTEELSYDRRGEARVLPLSEYGIRLIARDGAYLTPLQTVSDFLVSPMANCCCFFNGERLILSEEIMPDCDFYYSVPTGERSEALTRLGCGELCLMLDSFYGLKEAHGVDSFARFFSDLGADALLAGDSVEEADAALCDVLLYYLDDLHSDFCGFSYLAGPHPEYVLWDGDSGTRWAEQYERYLEARENARPEGFPGYEEVGNTAYVTFDEFAVDLFAEPWDYYDPGFRRRTREEDTIALIIYAHEQITREDSPVENVVLDLSCNTGGVVDAAVYTLSWFLGEASLSLQDTFTGASSVLRYRADVDLDHRFDEGDALADKNLFCLISPVSFSCGSLVPSLLKESGRVTLLGRTSGGGSCSVLSASTAWGTSFCISGNQRYACLRNGSLYDVDRGADPDFVLTSPESYYDREALTEYVNGIY